VDSVAVVREPLKPRFATAWLGGCSGCHMSFLDLDERLIDLAGLVDICYTPIMDVKEFPEGVDIALVEGAVANEWHLHDIQEIRRRSRVLIAFGDCAVTGNVTALRNLFGVQNILQRAYGDADVVRGIPGETKDLPKLLDSVLRIQDVVKVDHYLPGCPPSADTIYDFLIDLLEGRTPVTTGRKFGS
jgi:NAD-reducing hydrogenase small subunit